MPHLLNDRIVITESSVGQTCDQRIGPKGARTRCPQPAPYTVTAVDDHDEDPDDPAVGSDHCCIDHVLGSLASCLDLSRTQATTTT